MDKPKPTKSYRGRHPLLLGLTDEQREKISAAAEIDGRPMTQFVLHYSLAAAEKILKKIPKSA